MSTKKKDTRKHPPEYYKKRRAAFIKPTARFRNWDDV